MMPGAPPIVGSLDPELASHWPRLLSSSDVEPLLIRAIFAKQLAECSRALLDLPPEQLAESARNVARAALTACETIRAETIAEQARICELLAAAGIAANSDLPATPSRMQFHSFEIGVAPADVDRALAVADADGFHAWAPRQGAAWESFRRTHTAVTLVKADAVTTRLILRWAPKAAPSRLRNALEPSTLDYQLVDLPRVLWPLYHLLRPVRVAFDRLARGRRRRSAWPYLGTPSGLVDPMLDLAAVNANDRVVDLGCGDGRILIDAARSRRCRGFGIEQDPTYAAIAQQNLAAASVADLVRIDAGDATRADVSDATVVFLFLPPEAVAKLVPGLLQKLRPGARILTHEQLPLAAGLIPGRSKPVFAANSLTVAHLWTVD